MVLGVASKSQSSSAKGGHGSFNISFAASIARSQYNLGSISGTSSSRHIHRFSSSVSRATRCATTKNVLLNPTGILRQQCLEETNYLTCTEAMSSTQLEQLHAATVIHDDYNTITSCSLSPAINIDDILLGNSQFDLSHEGGEFAELLAMDEDVLGPPAW